MASLKEWKEGRSKADAKWDAWDCDIQQIVRDFNVHLNGQGPLNKPLDWKIVKAMIWTETSPSYPAWNTRPMQIGNEGDPGMRAVLFGVEVLNGDNTHISETEGTDLILPPSLAKKLTSHSIRTKPLDNIKAGVCYLLARLIGEGGVETKSVPTADPKEYTVTVKKGDALVKLAKEHGTTVDAFKRYLPPNANPGQLKLGQVLTFKKEVYKRSISGWRSPTPETIATRYNWGDPDYADKLTFVYDVISKRKTSVCK